MIYQISSGQGPAECELAVAKLLAYLQKNYDITIINTNKGYNTGTFRSIRFFTFKDLSKYVGSIQWICQSPYRPSHKRKNWFIDFSECITNHIKEFDENQIKFETFHCGGNGGQNVNKVETGIRAIYVPNGISVECTEERSQLQNKHKAIKRLKSIIESNNKQQKDMEINDAWKKHTRIVRGNATTKFEGIDFSLKE